MNKFSNLQKYELYIISLWFLFLLIIIVTIDVPLCVGENCHFLGFTKLVVDNIVPLVSLAFVLTGIFCYYRFKHAINGAKSLAVKVTKIQDINYEHLTFLTTYIIPLICFNLSSTRYLIALAILLVVIGAIYVKTDKFYANPTLALLGFRVYCANLETRSGTKENIVLITLSRVLEGDSIDYQEIDEKIYFARKK